ncbi:MAG: site-2 protease family protein [Acidobacteria bacterium]|nr:MAG: site-2 protease family protein [Acidobacteriota bacterium]
MRWSLRLGSIAGITVSMHLTFLLLLVWVALASWAGGGGLADAVEGVGFTLAIFGCVVLHELGHALMARRFGIRTRDITLLPIGGVARLERMPEQPRQELLVALAGPAVNVALAALILAFAIASGSIPALGSFGQGDFVGRLLVVNVMLAGFNLLPAFPMDGGRVLRALLAERMSYTRATQIAAGVGQAVALVFGFIGLFTNPFLLFIALFVWIGAAQEAAVTQARGVIGGIPVGRAMIGEFHVLDPRSPLREAVELTLATTERDFPVVDGGRLVGILTQPRMLEGLARSGPEAPIGEFVETDFVTADPRDALDLALDRLEGHACRTIPVLRDGRLVGLVTPDNIGELLAIRSALERGAGASPAAGR